MVVFAQGVGGVAKMLEIFFKKFKTFLNIRASITVERAKPDTDKY